MKAISQFTVVAPQRRGRSRLKTCLGAEVLSLAGSLGAELIDLSLTGAKLKIVHRRRVVEGIRPRETVVLTWAGFEAMGNVVWVRGDFLGVVFDGIVSPQVLIATRDLSDELLAQGGQAVELRRTVRDWVGVK